MRCSQSIEAFVGDRVHETLEYLHGHHWMQHRICSPRELANVYRNRWSEEWHAGVRVPRWREGRYFDEGLMCIGNYYEANYPFDQSRTLNIEADLTFQIEDEWGNIIEFSGRADRIASRPDGTIEIHDYKTGILTEAALEKGRYQLGLYQYAFQWQNPNVYHIELFLHFLRRRRLFRWRLRDSEIEEIVQDWVC